MSNMSIGVCLGMAIGMCIGALLDSSAKKRRKEIWEEWEKQK